MITKLIASLLGFNYNFLHTTKKFREHHPKIYGLKYKTHTFAAELSLKPNEFFNQKHAEETLADFLKFNIHPYFENFEGVQALEIHAVLSPA